MSIAAIEVGQTTNLTASGAICNNPSQMLGFYVNSTTGGTIVIRDGGSSGTALGGTITPAIGFHRYPVQFATSGYATIANTIDVTFFYAPNKG